MENSRDKQKNWPKWFHALNHPIEEDVLRRVLDENERIGTAFAVVHMMQINYGVFARNYQELKKLQDKFNDPIVFKELALGTREGKDIAIDTILEYTRLLHNFLASVKMLVDTTRYWIGEVFVETDFINEYQNKIEKHFVKNIQAQFLENLRNFTLHRTLPISKPDLQMTRVSEKTMKSSVSLVLDKTQLLEWKRWSKLARQQIEFFPNNNIGIEQITKLYFENVTVFSKWLFWRIREIFDPEIEYYNSVLENLRRG